MKNRKMIAVYVDEDMYSQIEYEAENSDRSLSSQARQLIKKGLGPSNMVELSEDGRHFVKIKK